METIDYFFIVFLVRCEFFGFVVKPLVCVQQIYYSEVGKYVGHVFYSYDHMTSVLKKA